MGFVCVSAHRSAPLGTTEFCDLFPNPQLWWHTNHVSNSRFLSFYPCWVIYFMDPMQMCCNYLNSRIAIQGDSPPGPAVV